MLAIQTLGAMVGVAVASGVFAAVLANKLLALAAEVTRRESVVGQLITMYIITNRHTIICFTL